MMKTLAMKLMAWNLVMNQEFKKNMNKMYFKNIYKRLLGIFIFLVYIQELHKSWENYLSEIYKKKKKNNAWW